MNGPLIQPGKYNLKSLTLITEKGQTVNIKDIFVEMTLEESIYQSAIFGSVLVADSNNLISGSLALPIMGNEVIIVQLDLPDWYPATYEEDPSADSDAFIPRTNSILYIGRVTSVKKREPINDKSQSYIIDFCSEELVRSENKKISKSYKGTPSQIAQKIFLEEVGTENPDSFFEATTNQIRVVVPTWTPFRTINWLASRSISEVAQSPTFFFYQSLYSELSYDNSITSRFWFRSLDDMLSNKPLKTLYYGLANVKADDPSKNLRIESLEIKQDFDSITNISNGLFANKLITHDVVKKQWAFSDYNYYLSFPSMNHNDGGKLYRGDIDREGKKFTDYPESTIYMHSVGTPEAPNYIGAISNRRSSQMASLDSMVLNMLIPGDGIIYPGSKIKFSYKSFEFTTRVNNEINDTFYDGDYLVTGIKHQFISEKYRMTLTCSKESLKINVEDYARSI
jgi:hypothetical protein